MKKTIFTFIVSATLLTNINAQEIPNAGFEDWQNQGTYEDPTGWVTSNFLSQLGYPVNVFKVADPYSGNYVIKLQTVDYNNSILAGGGQLQQRICCLS